MKIIDLSLENQRAIQQTAEILVLGFQEHFSEAWPNFESALEEIQEDLQGDNINRIAIDDDGQVLGWIGGRSEYYGRSWEQMMKII